MNNPWFLLGVVLFFVLAYVLSRWRAFPADDDHFVDISMEWVETSPNDADD
jgi:hypothetical protein